MATPTFAGRCRQTNGTRSRSITRAARPAIRRVSSIITAAQRSCATPTPSLPAWASTRSISGRCPWSISLVSGTHVCLRAVRAKQMYDAISDHRVTHLSGAPFVMAALLGASEEEKREFSQRVAFSHAAAPPPGAVLAKMDEAGFELTH